MREEAGVEVGTPEYVASQPWPFPSSLMLGFSAPWISGEPRRIDEELEDVRWFSRADVAAAVDDREGPLGVPPRFAIARRLLESGSGASLPVEVTLEGWIFMVGLRVFDIGALIVWLIWFFRLRDDDDDADDGRGGGGSAPEPETPRGRPAACACRCPTPLRGRRGGATTAATCAPPPRPAGAGARAGPGSRSGQKTVSVREAWINLDGVWAGAFVLAGLLTLFT